jgi:hypothetical protein
MLKLNPPKVQEQIVFSTTGSASSAQPAAASQPAPCISNYRNALNNTTTTSQQSNQLDVASSFTPTAAGVRNSHNHGSSAHKSHRKSRSPDVDNDSAEPADFANLINTDKLKDGVNPQSLLQKTAAGVGVKTHSSPRGKSDKRKRSSHADSDSDEGSDSEGSDSEGSGSGSESESDSGSESDSDSSSDEGAGRKRSAASSPLPTAQSMPYGLDSAANKQMMMEKARVLARLARRQKLNPNASIEFNHNMPLDELMTIDAKVGYESQAEMSIQFMKRCILFLVNMSENASKRYPALGMDLEGWGQYMFQRLNQYDELLFEIHDQYASSVTVNPLIRLGLEMVTNAWMYSAARTMMAEAGQRHANAFDQLNNKLKQQMAEEMRKQQQQQQQQESQHPTMPPPTASHNQNASPPITVGVRATKPEVKINPTAMKPPSTIGSSTADAAKLIKLLTSQQQSSSSTDIRKVDIALGGKGRSHAH